MSALDSFLMQKAMCRLQLALPTNELLDRWRALPVAEQEGLQRALVATLADLTAEVACGVSAPTKEQFLQFMERSYLHAGAPPATAEAMGAAGAGSAPFRRYARVVRVEFDTMENSFAAALGEKTAVIFCDDESGSAADKAALWVALQKDEQYMGWDKQVYPRYRLEEGVLA